MFKRSAVQLLFRHRRASFRNRAEEILLGEPSIERLLLMFRRILTDQQLQSIGVSAKRAGLPDTFLPLDAVHQERRGQEDYWRRAPATSFGTISHLESTLYMGNTLLRDTDVVSMACSQEVRVPFLDKRLVDVVGRLPVEVKTRRGRPLKWLLREACADLIPAELIQRRKTGFSLPIDRWMHGVLRDSCEACVDAAAECGLLDAGGVRQLWAEFISSQTHAHWVRPMTIVALGNYLTRVRAPS